MADRAMDGLDGASAYELARASGFRGSLDEWLVSLKGEPGQDGRSVTPDEVRALVEAEVAKIAPPRDGADGRDGRDGIDGKDGARGPRGERGMEGAGAKLPPLVPWKADYYRDEVTKLVTRVRAGPAGGGQGVNLLIVRGDDDLIDHIDLVPEAA